MKIAEGSRNMGVNLEDRTSLACVVQKYKSLSVSDCREGMISNSQFLRGEFSIKLQGDEVLLGHGGVSKITMMGSPSDIVYEAKLDFKDGVVNGDGPTSGSSIELIGRSLALDMSYLNGPSDPSLDEQRSGEG
ncbi:hypothetical protein Ddye_013790 [Dipteronia dyeriana]|uniref:Uncharacterized protein n=1 Tax=Dipteronia dyeriana TaxID=168575 RepID=A0AAE0CJZ7_9ROSI|nr:hypothetical protein Ddye_013790 [Dipteronia dyeriana]